MTCFKTKARCGRRAALATKAAFDVMLFPASTPVRFVSRADDIAARRTMEAAMKPVFVRHQAEEAVAQVDVAQEGTQNDSPISFAAILAASRSKDASRAA
ncbi:hypothetical protein AQS8620_00292 [Aquimixticola soesokkakensis]|uniref:Uncharacterized protein n=1 Tax=Aquimixticola soesokkakensis TaxID=1519096 RepID=A0A1Y5RGA5_9RHOB|nr:hypothetical protein [Aquimixticola soesokkakensis]SLN15552.1 hypothetical protein AQS8620_00292 [Aquimixticola soesokkakensis]